MIVVLTLASAIAQTRESVIQLSPASGAVEVNSGQDSAFFVFNVGGLVNAPTAVVGTMDERISLGFPYPARYFSNVFAQDFFYLQGILSECDSIAMGYSIKCRSD